MEFQFAGLADFLLMDGHGVFVWIAYGATFAALVALALYPRLRRRQLQRQLQRQQKIRRRRQQVKKARTSVAEPA